MVNLSFVVFVVCKVFILNLQLRIIHIISDENQSPAELDIATTPRKSRYRAALDTPPVTPKHRVQVGANAKPVTPRATGRQTCAPFPSQSVYTQARQLFARGANTGRLIGRENEREKLASFIQNNIDSGTGGCLYVSGPPGTGKSAMVEEVCREFDILVEDGKLRMSHVNCVNMNNARDIYGKLIGDLNSGDLQTHSQVFKKGESSRLKDIFIPDHRKGAPPVTLVTLDEIDHLLTADSDILQSLFEWSLHPKSRLILIGIANALDLTDRALPKLKARNLKPNRLPFLPYNATQIANVITNRLKSLLPVDSSPEDSNFVPFVQPAAIQLCSKKVAAQTGDLRKAFELVKRAIDTIEMETRRKLEEQQQQTSTDTDTVLVENMNLSTHSSPGTTRSTTEQQQQQQQQTSLARYTATTAPRASIAHVARITSMAFGQGTIQRLQNLNLQQKATICALITLDRKRRNNTNETTLLPSSNTSPKSSMRNQQAPTVKQAFDTYCSLCRNDNIIHPLTATEFKDVLSNLETMGLVGEYQGGYRDFGGGVGAGGTYSPSSSKSSPRRGGGGGGTTTTPVRGPDENRLVCFVSQKEIEGQISGPGENILRRLLEC